MKISKDKILYSPTDLNNFVSCKYHIKNDKLFFPKNTKGIKVPARNFIAMDAKRMKKPINAIMKKIGKALKK